MFVFVGEVLSKVINSVEESGAKYAVLYVSDPSRSIRYPSYRELQRFLEESAESTNSTACDKVCQLKSSLLEGIFVVSFFVHFKFISIIVKLASHLLCFPLIRPKTAMMTYHHHLLADLITGRVG